MKYEYAVITKVPNPLDDQGNLALCGPIYCETRERKIVSAVDILGNAIFAMRSPVFHLSEILILDDYGREPCGLGRNPSKWNIDYETFDNIEAAIEKAKEVYDSEA
jgi:hypothetical protein